ncbi:hypothetical protein NDN08_004052 [Rhodosorus marinus]|uniref:Uncharacterized protein n=1 Tax=Rhodosorus marinus TaxID=101924 RepID=A0AAV8UKL0_9RHOD|nr:hypothetical protein NDN08_004052 [Rhodosorus marinus]
MGNAVCVILRVLEEIAFTAETRNKTLLNRTALPTKVKRVSGNKLTCAKATFKKSRKRVSFSDEVEVVYFRQTYPATRDLEPTASWSQGVCSVETRPKSQARIAVNRGQAPRRKSSKGLKMKGSQFFQSWHPAGNVRNSGIAC